MEGRVCDYIENLELAGCRSKSVAILKFKPGTTNGICVCIGSTDDFDSLQRAHHILAGSFTPCRQVAKSVIPFFFSFLFLVSPVLSFFFLLPTAFAVPPENADRSERTKGFTSD